MHPRICAALIVASACARSPNIVPETIRMPNITLRLADGAASAFIFENGSDDPVLIQAYGCIDAETYQLYNAGVPTPGPGLACVGGPFERDGMRLAEVGGDEWSAAPLREYLVEPSGLATFVESRHMRHHTSAATPTLVGEYRFRVPFRNVGSSGNEEVTASFRIVGASLQSARLALWQLQRRASLECRSAGIGIFAASAPPELLPELLSLRIESLVESRAVASALAQRAEHHVHLRTMLVAANHVANLAASLTIPSALHSSDADQRIAARHLSAFLRAYLRNTELAQEEYFLAEVLRALTLLSAETWPRETQRIIVVLLARAGGEEVRDALVSLTSRELDAFQAFYAELVPLLDAECCGLESQLRERQLRERIEVALGRREELDDLQCGDSIGFGAGPWRFLPSACRPYTEQLDRLLPPPRVVISPG